jgi:uncharacterized lipoprotein YmbA
MPPQQQPEFLTTKEFQAWAAGFDHRLEDALAARLQVAALTRRVAVLSDRSDRLERVTEHAQTKAGVISTVVSACVSAAMGFFFRPHA